MKYNQIQEEYKHFFPMNIKTLERDNYTCQKCGSKDKNIVVHHIDESRKLGRDKINNNLENLITLCKSCHGIIHKVNILEVMTPLTIDMIMELQKNGKKISEIAEYTGHTRGRIYQILKLKRRQKRMTKFLEKMKKTVAY